MEIVNICLVCEVILYSCSCCKELSDFELFCILQRNSLVLYTWCPERCSFLILFNNFCRFLWQPWCNYFSQ